MCGDQEKKKKKKEKKKKLSMKMKKKEIYVRCMSYTRKYIDIIWSPPKTKKIKDSS